MSAVLSMVSSSAASKIARKARAARRGGGVRHLETPHLVALVAADREGDLGVSAAKITTGEWVDLWSAALGHMTESAVCALSA